MLGKSGGSLIAGKVGYAVACVAAAVVLAVSGWAHNVVSLTQSLGGGISISNGASVGSMNILVMGLESRTDYQGQTLSAGLLAAMHAGSVNGVENEGVGGQATNTLILLHIFAGGQKAVGFSIPRDDWVTYPQTYDGQSAGKIDQAYGDAYAQSLQETVTSSMSSAAALPEGQPGRAGGHHRHRAGGHRAADRSLRRGEPGRVLLPGRGVRRHRGLHQAVTPATPTCSDGNSGFNAVLDGYNVKKGGAQYLHLSAPQALAFVRERDNLPNGDLDRTHRQQAVLDYVIWKLETGGVLSDLGQLTALLNTAKQYLITDATWNLLDFATNMHALSGKNLQFYTAPIRLRDHRRPGRPTRSTSPTIQAAIKAKFTAPAPKSASSAKAGTPGDAGPARVYRHGGRLQRRNRRGPGHRRLGCARRQGVQGGRGHQRVGAVGRSPPRARRCSTAAGASANAAKIAGYFGATATARSSLAAGHVEVLLGTGVHRGPFWPVVRVGQYAQRAGGVCLIRVVRGR